MQTTSPAFASPELADLVEEYVKVLENGQQLPDRWKRVVHFGPAASDNGR